MFTKTVSIFFSIFTFCISCGYGDLVYGYINAWGERLNTPPFLFATDFSDGFAMCRMTNEEWVVLSSDGNTKPLCRSMSNDEVMEFSEGITLFSDYESKTTFTIDTKGNILFELSGLPVSRFNKSIMLVFKEYLKSEERPTEYNLVDFNGINLTSNKYQFIYHNIGSHALGLKWQKNSSKCINDFSISKPFIFDSVGNEIALSTNEFTFSNYDFYGDYYTISRKITPNDKDYQNMNISVYKSDGRLLFETDEVFRIVFDSVNEGILGGISNFSNKRKFIFFDLAGRIVLDGRTDNRIASAVCSEGLIKSRDPITGLYGFIDRTGRDRIRPIFKDVGNFSEGLAWVIDKDNRLCYVDTQGKIRITTQYTDDDYLECRDFHNGFAIIPIGTYNEKDDRISSKW